MIQYSNYKYIGQHEEGADPNNYAFDKQKYDRMLAANRFEDAAYYLEQFQFDDPERQEQQVHYISQLKHEGRKVQAYYGRLTDNEKHTVSFANSVFAPGGLKNLRYQSDGDGNYIYNTDEEFQEANPEAARFIQLLNDIGSTRDIKADALRIEFDNAKYGLFGIDWLKRDHDDYQDMLRTMGITEKQLEAMGCNIERMDGKVILTFDKNADCATRLLTSIPQRTRNSNKAKIIGLHNGEEISRDMIWSTYTTTYGTGFYTEEQENNLAVKPSAWDSEHFDYAILKNMSDLVGAASEIRDDTERKRNLDKKVYSSTLFNIRTNRLDLLDELYESGQMDWKEYNARRKEEIGPDVTSFVKSINYGDYIIYSDYGNDDNIEVRKEVTQEDWEDLKEIISSTKPSKLHFLGETSNGEIGLHITIDNTAESGDKATEKDKNGKRIEIFIPGFMTDEIQQQMYGDTQLEAIQEWNDMVDYGYSYKLNNGTSIAVDENGNVFRYDKEGNVTMDTNPDAKDNAIRDLTEDFIKEAAKPMKYNFMNANGEYDYASYNELSKKYAVKATNELYPDIDLKTLDGTPITFEEIFTPEFKEKVFQHSEEFDYKTLKKLKRLYELYDYLTKDLLANYNPKIQIAK